jgi:hypothetical protein
MTIQKKKLINKGKIGLLFWLLTCFIGSIIVITIERQLFNEREGFYMSIYDGILLSIIMTIITLLGSSPVILAIYWFSTRLKSLVQLVTTALLLAFLIAYIITLNLSNSYFEALYITGSYFVFAFIFEFAYLKIEHSITSPQAPPA